MVIPLHLHPSFQERHRVEALKNTLLAETLAFTQMALDNAAKPGPTSAAQIWWEPRARRSMAAIMPGHHPEYP